MNSSPMWGYAAPYRLALGLSAAMMAAESGVALAVPWLGGRVAEGLLSRAMAGTGTILLALLGLLAVQALLRFGTSYLLSRSAEHILADLRLRVYDHLQALPLNFYHQRRHGEILSLLTYDVEVLSVFISGTPISVIPLLMTVAGAMAFMFALDPLLALVVATLMPSFYLLIRVLGRRLRPLALALQDAQAGALAIAQENLSMLPAIKTFTREPQESARYRRQIGHVLSLSAEQRRIYAALGPSVQLLAAAGIVLVLWLAGERVSGGQIGPGSLVTFLLYTTLLTRPVSALADVYGQTQGARGAMARLQRVLTERPEPFAAAAAALAPVRGEIEFRNVSFSYPDRPPALSDFTLRIRAGEIIGITGENGAGKSTLVHLLMRLHEPDAGQVLIDGVDIAGVGLRSLRRQIGIVPQHVLLFNATVRENIGLGGDDASPAAIEAAARAARAHDFIVGFPQGYDTLIGDRGVRLSGGQQQRVALARALLKNPPILILDEATAMFDPEGERQFLDACRDVLKHRTVLLITHRPAPLALTDRRVEIHGGRLVE